MKKIESEYNAQAREFAEKNNVTMKAEYLGHFCRLGEHATANFRITLERTGKKTYSFDYSDSINESWEYHDEYETKAFQRHKGLPLKIRTESYPKTGGQTKLGRYIISPVIPKPSFYDIFSCLTKYEPGTFENFCADYGYNEDSRKAFDIYQAVLKEWGGIVGLFGDCLEELQEIN